MIKWFLCYALKFDVKKTIYKSRRVSTQEVKTQESRQSILDRLYKKNEDVRVGCTSWYMYLCTR